MIIKLKWHTFSYLKIFNKIQKVQFTYNITKLLFVQKSFWCGRPDRPGFLCDFGARGFAGYRGRREVYVSKSKFKYSEEQVSLPSTMSKHKMRQRCVERLPDRPESPLQLVLNIFVFSFPAGFH